MAPNESLTRQCFTRRRFIKTGLSAAAGLAIYPGEIERHWIDVSQRDVHLRNLPASFDGLHVVQLSDIHLDEFTERFFLRQAIQTINRMRPDVVVLTGDYVTYELSSRKYAVRSAGQCAEILSELDCPQRYAILGNHDFLLGENEVASELKSHGIPVLKNQYVPIEKSGSRIWLAGLDDPLFGNPDPDAAIPYSIRNVPGEPVILLCHEPDYADNLLAQPAGKAVDLMLSGHTHGGQVRLPFVGGIHLPPQGRKYVEGWFTLGQMQLHVNRGLGTVGVPFRFNCPPEITSMRLRTRQA
jgi:predicted MPP superfamily phosphohydrolase